ncbi:MAG: ferritin-like domain-containing protein [Candidatus Nanopelagicales bacterium]
MTDFSSDQIGALQDTLQGEYAAIYAYGVIGARSVGEDQRLKGLRAMRTHTALRDWLREQLNASGTAAVPAAPSYQLPNPITDNKTAAKAAATIENRLARSWAALAARTPITDDNVTSRQYAVNTSMECGTRAVSWGSGVQAFPH